MRRATAGVVAVIVLVVLLGGCRGGTNATAKSALSGLAGVGDDVGASADDILRRQQELRGLPDEAFSADDLARRSTLLAQSDGWLAAAVVAEVDDAVALELQRVSTAAGEVVSRATNITDQAFRRDFATVTEELVVGAACGAILDRLAPEEQPAEAGKGSAWVDAAQEGYDKLAARWSGPSFVNLVNWTYYATSVMDDSEQLVEALIDHPEEYVRFAAAPEVRRVLVVYLRTCYSPPKAFTPGTR